ncbi:MAG: Lipid A export ATP-binding/permease protein MsbA [Alphaproteobacteria bacterium MarineAlpha6_Bin6]|nr:ABC transporter permease [Pelagibacteraceae bacterium]PPR29000.1 MAG: Lipid A export ATP-binding/permease protein MsbA [Alphaproteobacteria bacterium MarineAlpha6_Bin6]PPR33563.1 MAG: Lipid A export ATP-binding/permease protein MsbA [Alphaproteobacteria bacterium MarineAlpha6_Bin5]|tara:strand:- start:767 stop:2575 length:1809 start_codon:yes stop_codon:yes gene_type:complete
MQIKSEKSIKLIKRLIKEHVRPYFGKLLLAALCMAVVSAATATNAWLMQPVLDEVFLNKNAQLLLLVPIAVMTIAIVKGVASYGESIFMEYSGERIISDVRYRLFSHLMNADLNFFHNTSSGKLISRFTYDVGLLRASVSTALTGIAKDTMTLTFLVALMFYQDWFLAIIAFFVFPAAVLPILYIGRKIRKISTSTQHEIGSFASLLSQIFQSARYVKAYTMQKYEKKRAKKIVEDLFNLIYKSVRVRSRTRPILESLGGIAIALVIFYGGSKVISGTTTPGTFFSFITALLMAYQPLKRLANFNVNIQDGLAAADRIFQLLDQKPEISDKPNSKKYIHKKGEIEFKKVRFSYGSKSSHALNNINLKIPGGKTVALVGKTGAGKSTILNLIPRFYDTQKGLILVDKKDIKNYKIQSLREKIALVSQEVTLFDDTIRANIAYGNPNCSEKQLIEAAKKADAHEFIISFKNGYRSIVGEHGIQLSGGQRQKIAIARAILKDAPILLLDEATASLDSNSEKDIQKSLKKLMRNKTTLVIAHRLSTILDANLIYVIDNGKVLEKGNHKALMKNKGLYSKLYKLQFAGQKSSTNKIVNLKDYIDKKI